MGGNPNVLIAKPCITFLKICKNIFIGDGIYDHLENEEILKMIWEFKKKGNKFEDIHVLSGNITDAVIKYSMRKLSVDNVTVIFIVFENFEQKMKDENFEYIYSGNSCKYIGGEIDLNNNDKEYY